LAEQSQRFLRRIDLVLKLCDPDTQKQHRERGKGLRDKNFAVTIGARCKRGRQAGARPSTSKNDLGMTRRLANTKAGST